MGKYFSWIDRIAAMAMIGYQLVDRFRAVAADDVITDEELLYLAREAMRIYADRTGHAIQIPLPSANGPGA